MQQALHGPITRAIKRARGEEDWDERLDGWQAPEGWEPGPGDEGGEKKKKAKEPATGNENPITPPQAPTSRDGTPESSKTVPTSTDIDIAKQYLEGKKVTKLKELLSEFELDTKGRKAQLIDRLAKNQDFQEICLLKIKGLAGGAPKQMIAPTPTLSRAVRAEGPRAAPGSSNVTFTVSATTPDDTPPLNTPPLPAESVAQDQKANNKKEEESEETRDKEQGKNEKGSATGNTIALDLEN